MQVIYYDFPQNLKNIRDIVKSFELDLKCDFKHIIIVNLCFFNEYSEKILDEMEANGVIGPVRGAKPREIFVSRMAAEETAEVAENPQ
mgnify:CR=1 FL=1